MNYNTTLSNYIYSELINIGKNEFIENNKIIAFDKDKSFIGKIIRFDSDVKKIVNDNIFYGLSLDNEKSDDKFKRQFINRFFNHSINYQTVEGFAGKVINVFLNHIDFLNIYYSDIDSFITGKSTSKGLTNSENQSDNRQATSTLPQNQVNIDVDKTMLDYADNNSINRNKDRGKTEQENIYNRYEISNMEKSIYLLDKIFDEFEKNCFILTW